MLCSTEFVRYHDLARAHDTDNDTDDPVHTQRRYKRKAKSKRPTQLCTGGQRKDTGENCTSTAKLWTISSAVFFAATTMATIGKCAGGEWWRFHYLGYGNIVPVTVKGRIACIIFALIGAPLTIITIGDLGKFVSELTMWTDRRVKRLTKRVQILYRRLTRRMFGARPDDASVITDLA
jgi:hypothetical protein